MNIPWIVVILIGVFIILPAVIGAFFYFRSFIHRVHIAIQTGEDPSDVVWKEDKFKVISRQGYHTLVFRHMKGGSQSPPGNLWTKFLIGRKTFVDFDAGVWKTRGIANKIQRGLYLYRTLDGEFHPMSITSEGNFKVLSQDNRSFLISSDRDVQKLVLTGKQQLIAVIAVVLALIILGVCFVLFLVYLGNNTDKLCGLATTAQNSGVLAAAQAAVGG